MKTEKEIRERIKNLQKLRYETYIERECLESGICELKWVLDGKKEKV